MCYVFSERTIEFQDQFFLYVGVLIGNTINDSEIAATTK